MSFLPRDLPDLFTVQFDVAGFPTRTGFGKKRSNKLFDAWAYVGLRQPSIRAPVDVIPTPPAKLRRLRQVMAATPPIGKP